MKSFLLILCFLALCSWSMLQLNSTFKTWHETNYIHAPLNIITNKEAKVVMEYHGILSMKWSIPHKDFVFERNGEICRARAFEVIKERM